MDFDSEDLGSLIAEALQASNECNKEFGKFKGEFFALCEAILSKDTSQLNAVLV